MTLNKLISQIANSLQQPNSVPVRKALRLSIVQARNELIHQTFVNNHLIDKGLEQRYNVDLITIPDGDINTSGIHVAFPTYIKRTKNKVAKAVRLSSEIPFLSVRSVGFKQSLSIPFIREHSVRFYKHLKGFCNSISYDYINGYIYIMFDKESIYNSINKICIESVFEKPEIINIETNQNIETYIDDDGEYLIPEDMVNNIIKLVINNFNPNVIREENKIPNTNLTK